MTDLGLGEYTERLGKYTDLQLFEMQSGIDREKYPERYQAILLEIQSRINLGTYNPKNTAIRESIKI
jgi:hypothetical protein